MIPSSPRGSLSLFLLAMLSLLLVVGASGCQGSGNDAAGGQPQAAGEVFLEPAAEVGPNPFVATPLAATPDPTLAAPVVSQNATVQPPPKVAIQANSGAKPGLYGGSMNDTVCKVDQLVSFLGANPEKAAAWVAALNADPKLRPATSPLTTANIPAYISSLTPIVLLADTRVTNHGFENGLATPRQSVLQTGTAVLVDPYGIPRARCYCGNPLLPPVPSSVPVTYVGPVWAGFNPASVAVVSSAPQPQTSFQVTSPSGTLVQQPAGSGPAASTPPGTAAPGTTSASATTPVTATTATTTTAGTASGQAPYTVQNATSPDGRISMSVPTGWETESLWRWDDVAGQQVISQIYTASPSVAVSKDAATTYSQPEVQVRQFWPSTPGQALDTNAVHEATKSKLCTNAGSPQPYSHPKYGSGTSVTYTGCQGNPSAELQLITFPQPDGSVVQLRMKVLDARDRGNINTVLDSLTVPQISAPAPVNPKQLCSKSPPNAAPVNLAMTNTTTELLRVVWHDYNCQVDTTQYMWLVGPGETVNIPGTFEGNWYSAVALDGSTAGTYQVPAAGGTWTMP